MKKKILRLPPLTTASLLLAAIVAVLQTVSVLSQFEPQTGYFAKGEILLTLASVLALLAALAGTLSAFLEKPKNPAPDATVFSPGQFSFGAAPAFLLVFAVILLDPSFRSMRLAIPSLLFLLGATVYSVLLPLPGMRKHQNALALLGFCAVIACILLNTYLYFDMSVPMNAPLKTALQTALLCAMLYYVAEIRYLLGIPQPRVMRTVAGWTLASSALVFPALPIAFFLGDYPRADHAALATLAAFSAISAMLSLLRLHSLIPSNKQTESDERETDSSERTPQ